MKKILLIILVGFSHCVAWATAPCDTQSQRGEFCKIQLAQIHPTQFTVSKQLVEKKADKISNLADDELKDYLKGHSAPTVIGPQGKIYITDGHHLALALTNDDEKEMYATILTNLSDLSQEQFWGIMAKQHWLFLYDENGNGPLPPSELPKRLIDMRNDPYRALAKAAQKAGCYKKTKFFFADCLWANYFRRRVKLSVKAALQVCHMPAASNLPGFISE